MFMWLCHVVVRTRDAGEMANRVDPDEMDFGFPEIMETSSADAFGMTCRIHICDARHK